MHKPQYTDQITTAEWRWLLVCSAGLALAILLPFVFLPSALGGRIDGFAGVLHDPEGSASAIASMRLGERDEWLWRDLHTPEPQPGIVADALYIMLGHLARFIRLDALVLFHVARVLAALFMFHAFYVLAAAIWSRLNTRRIFWFITSVGGGLGWIAAPLLGRMTPDIAANAVFPFHAALMNVHLPLALGCMAFLVAAMLVSLRPDSYDLPSVTNNGLTLIVFSLTLALLYPQALLPMGIAYGVLLALDSRQRAVPRRNLQWFSWFIIPALPLLVYNMIVLASNPVVLQLWQLEARAAVPSLPLLLVALGLPLLIAVPGLYRAVRRFEPDGSAFMLLWLAAMLVFAYLLPFVRGKFLLGLMVPVAYFAARAINDVWFPLIPERRWRYRIVAAMAPVLFASSAVTLFAPLASAQRLTLPPDYGDAFNYLRTRLGPAVVASSGPVGIWLPAWTGQAAVFATPRLTLDATRKAAVIRRFYTAEAASDCDALLGGRASVGAPFRVRYVVFGPHERELGSDSVCLDGLVEMARFGSVSVFLTLR
jgi:hypothetical protein